MSTEEKPLPDAEIMTQGWHCSECGISGTFTYPEDTLVISALQKLGLEHNRVSPNCLVNHVYDIKLRLPKT